MGKEKRAREYTTSLQRERRWAWLKGLVGLLSFFPLLPFLYGYSCWQDNRWPWEF
jgi:hypothetical protein